jgi:signal peptidase I
MPSWRRTHAAAATLAAAIATAGCGSQVSRIQGHAMSPTLDDGDRVVMTPLAGAPVRGDVVGLRYPKDPAKRFVMRIVGMPGERLSIARGIVHIDAKPLEEPYIPDRVRKDQSFGPVQLGADEYFVMGDNRGNASDSREWGPVTRSHIYARWAWLP